MNTMRLSFRLSPERQRIFMEKRVWEKARSRGLHWHEAVRDEASVRETLASPGLSDSAKALLVSFIRLYGAAPAEEERMLAAMKGQTALSGAECKIGIRELQRCGILFAVSKSWGERIWFMPGDAFPIWMRACCPGTITPIHADDAEEFLYNGDYRALPVRRPLSRQLLSAFAALGRCGLELTAKGVLPKKTIAQLVQGAELDEDLLQDFGIKAAHRDHYPLAASFMLEAANELALIERRSGELVWNKAKLAEWMEQAFAMRELALAEWCYELLFSSSAMLSQMNALLLGLQPGAWYAAESVIAWMSAHGMAEQGNGQTGQWLERSCRLLHSLGWLELAELAGGANRFIFRWLIPQLPEGGEAAGEREHSRIMVQPNGEILADDHCPFAVRWELELMAERAGDEQITVYRMTARSLARAMESGRSRGWLESMLKQASGMPLEPAVCMLLKEWTNKACRTAFIEAILLHCDHQEMSELIRSDAHLSELIVRQVGPLDFLVNRNDINELRARLETLGYPPRKGIQGSGAAVSGSMPILYLAQQASDEERDGTETIEIMDAAAGGEWQHYIYPPFTLRHHELSDGEDYYNKERYEAMCAVMPGMWTKGMRSYHHSTRKEMIEQALNWEVPLQLRLTNGVHAFIPERLEQDRNGWSVHGVLRDSGDSRSVRLTPDMWEDMKIVIPSYSD